MNYRTIITYIAIITCTLTWGIHNVSAAPLNVSGWAWSFMPTATTEHNQDYNPNRPDGNVGQGTGWTSLSSTTGGVTVDNTTGQFSGYGWNEYFGYVNFSGAKVANPACLSSGTGTSLVEGTITFITNGGGWDGKVTMSDTARWNNPVTVDCVTGNMSGLGWGDYVVGYMDFKFAKIELTNPIDVCPDDPKYPDTIGPQATIPTPGWYFTTSNPPLCKPFVEIPGCFDTAANNYGEPPNANMVDNRLCTFDETDICKPLPPGVQTYSDMLGAMNQQPPGYLYNSKYYGLFAGVCLEDVCPGTYDANTIGFQAVMPQVRGPGGGIISYGIVNGICKPLTACVPGPGVVCPGPGGIDPSYEED